MEAAFSRLVVRLGAYLSGLAGALIALVTAWALLTAPEWFLVILIYAAIYLAVALAVIWLGVFVTHVIAKAIRVTKEAREL